MLASDILSGRPVALASELTGSGTLLADLDAAIVHELVSGDRTGAVERVDARLAAIGRGIERDKQPVTDPAERRALLAEAVAAVEQRIVPNLLRGGILVPR
jgi:hypothetical protein